MTTSLSIANPLTKRIRLSEQASGLSVSFEVLQGLAPDNAEFLWDFLAEPREMPALHAMWSGPEISCPIPSGLIPPDWSTRALPNENATVTPQAGDLVLIYVPARMWGGNSQPIFDLGFFYGHGGRLLFPVGWLAGSVVAKVEPSELAELARCCNEMRQRGACTLVLSREG